MVTLKAEDRRRMQLPDIKPGQFFAFVDLGDGSMVLSIFKVDRKEPFPPGSLRNQVEAMNHEWAGVKPSVAEPEGLD